MSYLGLDLGSKTLGVAISASGIIASPLETFRFIENHYDLAVAHVGHLVHTHGIKTVVLGLPKHMNNDLGVRGKISESFKEMIENACDVDVILWDERLSTQTALRALIKGSQSRSTQKQKKDELAAVVILQNYLDYQGRK